MKKYRFTVCFVTIFVLLGITAENPSTHDIQPRNPSLTAQNDSQEELKEIREPDVIFVPTPQHVVDKMLELAKVKKTDLIYDLGCGDGRILVTAAKKFGCKGIGYDIDPQRVKEARENVKKNKAEHLVRIEQKDIFTLDLSKANVITLYLLPSLNVRLIPQLEKLQKGSRIVSHDFDMKGVKPDKVLEIPMNDNPDNTSPDDEDYDDYDNYGDHTVYLWTLPLQKYDVGKEDNE